MALDLKKELPRSPFDELRGYAWLPRLIDKARADFAGTRGAYASYPCGADRRFLKFFRLDAAALGKLIRDGATDSELGDWVYKHARGNAVSFRAELRRGYTNPLLKGAVWWARRRLEKSVGASRPGVDWASLDTFAKLIACEEGYSIPQA